MKRHLLFLFTCILIISLVPLTSNADTVKSFSDVAEKHWAHDNITSLVDKGIINGYPDGKFRPNNNLTYGEFIKMVAQTYSDNSSIKTKSGVDWAVPYYTFLLEKEAFTEEQISKSKLNSKIPRSDMALIVSNALSSEKPELSTDKLKSQIADYNDLGKYSDQIVRAYGLGIITGYPNGLFRPDYSLTRAESAAVVMRIIDKNVRLYPEEEKVSKVKDLAKIWENPWCMGCYSTRDDLLDMECTFEDNSGYYFEDKSNWHGRFGNRCFAQNVGDIAVGLDENMNEIVCFETFYDANNLEGGLWYTAGGYGYDAAGNRIPSSSTYAGDYYEQYALKTGDNEFGLVKYFICIPPKEKKITRLLDIFGDKAIIIENPFYTGKPEWGSGK